jgi:hypothetical protein
MIKLRLSGENTVSQFPNPCRALLSLAAAITIGLFLAASAPAVVINPTALVRVDEDGHGLFETTFPSRISLLTYSMTSDPGPGGKSSVLAYSLNLPDSTPLIGGDVVIRESGDFNSDLVRFDPSNGGTLFFYSDIDGNPAVDALADVGLPTGRNTNLVTIDEIALSANGINGAFYVPLPDQPGYFPHGGSLSYIIISDTVPEPGSFLLLLPAAAALVLIYRKRLRPSRG